MKQRIIKFRAWDGEKMFDDVPPSLVPLGANAVIAGTTCEVMQFTGLLDKNGKEIYEGDVVLFGRHLKYKVEWEDYIAPADSYSGWSICKADEYGYEIIGNIYENPELLDKQKLI